VKIMSIPDISTRLAALRTGKIDYLPDLGWQQMASVTRTNPELQKVEVLAEGYNIVLRNDHKPFNDIRVRQAMQMALDLETIAKTHFHGSVAGKPAGIVHPLGSISHGKV